MKYEEITRLFNVEWDYEMPITSGILFAQKVWREAYKRGFDAGKKDEHLANERATTKENYR